MANPTSARTSSFEIKIALLGNSECGKTTTLNALLRANYGGAVMSKRKSSEIIGYNVNVAGVGVNNDENGPIAELKIAAEETIKLKDGDEIHSITFDVDVEKEIVPMRSDTRLSFVVVPGFVDGTTKYQSYISEKWDAFDAVIFVMDGKKGISEGDISLLKLVKESQQKRDVPIIILCNKIDNADDEKLVRHAKKAQAKVEKIFQVNCDESAEPTNLTFIPVSALQGFIYRAGARMTVYQFEDFDKDLMEIVGKEHLGSKNWKKMTHEDRFRKTHTIISDPKHFKDGMSDCGFDKFMEAVEHFLGGEKTQKHLIQKQIDLSLSQLSPFQTEWISYTIFSAYQKQIKLSEGSKDLAESLASQSRLREAFWTTFEEYQAGTFQKFMNDFPANVNLVADPLQELMYYHKLVDRAKWKGEEELVIDKMKAFVRRYLHFLIQREHDTNGNTFWTTASNISPIDWSIIWRSILLLSYDQAFCESFGRIHIVCQALAQEANNWKASPGADKNCPHCFAELDKTKKTPVYPRCKACSVVFMPGDKITESLDCAYCGHGKIGGENFQCENCKYKHEESVNLNEWLKKSYSDDGNLTPTHPEKYNKVVHLEIIESLDDPTHYGHPVHKFCNFVASRGDKKCKASEGK
jgi:GTP-binding protein EngB required for normal cell division